jgi:hypothetical protein
MLARAKLEHAVAYRVFFTLEKKHGLTAIEAKLNEAHLFNEVIRNILALIFFLIRTIYPKRRVLSSTGFLTLK